MLKVLVVDDHVLVREGMRNVLARLSSDVQVLQAADGQAALGLAAENPDLDAILLDLRMAGMGGLEAVAAFHASQPTVPVIVLSSSEDPADVRRALAAGARGYCPKSAPESTLLAAVRLVLSGEVYVPPLMLDAAGSRTQLGVNHGLTARQVEVLQAVCAGQSNKQIARDLAMQESTVKAHLTTIFRTLGVVSRTQAIEAARAGGITG